ncbi:dihydrodipicolinate synthase family protein [Paenibacillus yanchengensis]|uniref:Dihydrodipicolinate synthase family protein n=1 Tax=Paenibacillus yanchengensis TaxID=2035833 RepID=A0ABW4YQ27_9BACL
MNKLNKQIGGIIPIAAAPFTNSGLLDEDSFQQMIRHLQQTGANGITLFGLATEFHKLSEQEMDTMVDITLRELESTPNVVSMVSITEHTSEHAVRRAKQAANLGADSLMLLPPFFLQPSEAALIDHISKVAASVEIPIIVQYAPSQTGVRIAPSVFLQLHEQHPNIQFIKVETQPPGRYVSQLIEGSQGKLGSLVGYAGVQMPDVLDRGASGIQPGCSFTEIYVALFDLYQSGNREAFDALFQRLLPFTSYWMQGVELIIQVEKVILQKRGIIASDYCRTPYYALDQIERNMID